MSAATAAAAVGGDAGRWRFPAEFEPHAAVWLCWAVRTDRRGSPPQAVQKAIIAALAGHVDVHLIVQDAADEERVRRELEQDAVPTQHVRFFAIPHGEMWLRDFGPIFLVSTDATKRRSLAIADFGFNYWGFEGHVKTSQPEDVIREGLVARRAAAQLELPVIRSSLVSEGGNREFNGRGTLLVSEVVERDRNPHMSKDEMELEFKRTLGVTNVIWLQKGPAEDYAAWRGQLPGGGVFCTAGTGGHVDEFARFADASTVILCSVPDDATDPISQESRVIMDANRKILENSRDQDGQPFKIVLLPMPDPVLVTVEAEDPVHQLLQDLVFDDGSVVSADGPCTVAIAASYANFLVTNGVVLMPRYYREGGNLRHKESDAAAVAILQRCFPDRRIVALDVFALNIGGGGIHCITQQQPRI